MAKSKISDPANQRVVIICPSSDPDADHMFTQKEAFRLVKPLLESNMLLCSDGVDMDDYFAFTVTPPAAGWTDTDDAVFSSAVSALAEFGYEIGVGCMLDVDDLEPTDFSMDCPDEIDEAASGARAVGIATLSTLAVLGLVAVHAIAGHRRG